MAKRKLFIDGTPDFKPGDSPPPGYIAWHEWAVVQVKAGLKQTRCRGCRLYLFPQETAEHICIGEEKP